MNLAPAAALILLATLSACGSSDEASTPEATVTVTETPAASTSPASTQTTIEDACAAVANLPDDFAEPSEWLEVSDDLLALAEDSTLEAQGVLLPVLDATVAYADDPAPGKDGAAAFDLLTNAQSEIADRCE